MNRNHQPVGGSGAQGALAGSIAEDNHTGPSRRLADGGPGGEVTGSGVGVIAPPSMFAGACREGTNGLD
jgi:hypothetical protein